MREDLPEPKCWLLLSTWSLLLRLMSSAHIILVQVARKLFAEGDLTIWAEINLHSLILRVGVNKLQRSFQWARIIAWQAWGVRVAADNSTLLNAISISDTVVLVTKENTCHPGGRHHGAQVWRGRARELSHRLRTQAWSDLKQFHWGTLKDWKLVYYKNKP